MPDVSTEVAIATTTLGAGADSINFTSISSAYTDLRLVFTGKSQPTNTRFPVIRFNSDTGYTYYDVLLSGNGSTANTNYNGLDYFYISESGMSDTNPVLYTVDIFSYAGSTLKSILVTSSEERSGSTSVTYRIGLWNSTSAITSINLLGASGVGIFATGSTATLYGIL
jgi:hypothetical protein